MATVDVVTTVVPTAGLLSLLGLAVRAMFTGALVTRNQHDQALTELREQRDIWRQNSEKWEGIAEGRLKAVQQRQEAVVNVTTQVVEGIRKVGTADVAVEKEH